MTLKDIRKEFYLYCIRSSLFTLPILRKISAKFQKRYIGISSDGKLGLHVHFDSPHRAGSISIGRAVEVASNAYVDFSGGLIIRDNVTISADAKIFTHNHDVGESGDWRKRRPVFSELEIGEGAWIGANAIILPSVKSIGSGAIIGAGSVVTRDVSPNMIVAGNPAKPIRTRI